MKADLSNFYQDAPRKRIGLCLFNRATYARSKILIDEILRYPNIDLTLFLSSALLWDKFGKAADYIEREHPGAKVVRVQVDPFVGTHSGMVKAQAQIQAALVDPVEAARLDFGIVVADRFETEAAANVFSGLNIPFGHIQGGEITGCIDDKVRHSVTMRADFHFCTTRLAREYLVQMGQDTKRVFYTGCPSIDLIRRIRVKRIYPKERYVLAIFHPETEKADQAFEQTKAVCEAVIDYCRELKTRCYWYYPNPDPGREEIIRYLDQTLVEWPDLLIKAVNQEPEDFLHQLGGARLVVGNSSCGLRESSYLGVPVVNIGSRQRLRERSFNVVDVGYYREDLVTALRTQHRAKKYPKSNLYGSGNASAAIARFIQHIDLSIKGALTYPTWEKFKPYHFGDDRFHGHRKKRRTTVGYRLQKKAEQAEAHQG